MVWQIACNMVEGRSAPLGAPERQSGIMIDAFTGFIYHQVGCVLGEVGVEARLEYVEG